MQYLDYADAVVAAHDIVQAGGGLPEIAAAAKPHWSISPEEAMWLRSSAHLAVKPIVKLFNNMKHGAQARRIISEGLHAERVRRLRVHTVALDADADSGW